MFFWRLSILRKIKTELKYCDILYLCYVRKIEQSESFNSLKEDALSTFGINCLDFISGLARSAGSESVQGSDSVGVPLALDQTCHLALQLGHQVPAGFPLIHSSLAAVHVVASDAAAAIILWWLPGQKDVAGGLVSPPQVLWRVRYSYWGNEMEGLESS